MRSAVDKPFQQAIRNAKLFGLHDEIEYVIQDVKECIDGLRAAAEFENTIITISALLDYARQIRKEIDNA